MFGELMARLIKVTVLGGLALLVMFGVYVLAGAPEPPVAVVCDMGEPNVELSSTALGGYFEEHRIGPCVLYVHKSRPVGD